MDRQVVAITLLLVSSGCMTVPFGGGEPSTARETLTPVPLSPVETTARTDTSADLPGVSDAGNVYAKRLRKAHETYLEGQSYTWVLRHETRGPPEAASTYDTSLERRVRVGDDRFLAEQRGDLGTWSLFVDGTGGYLRTVEDNVTRTRLTDPTGVNEDYADAGAAIERFLDGTEPDVTRVSLNGRTYYRLHAATGAPPGLGSLVSVVRNYSVTAYVSPTGFVRSMVVSYDRSLDDGFKSVYFRFTYSAVGETTIETPIWVEELTPATPVSATRSQGDTSTTTRVESGKPGERTATARTPVPTPPNATGE